MTMTEDRMLKWFEYEHLPETLKEVSSPFGLIARKLCYDLEAHNALEKRVKERTVALRKLLEAKDAAVRAKVNPGG